MGLTNPLHLAFIAIIALIFLGPKRLPELAKSLGSGMREFRESISGEKDHDEPPPITAAVEAPTVADVPAPVPPLAPPVPAQHSDSPEHA